MKRMEFSYELTPEMLEEKKLRVQKLLKEPLVRDWLRKHHQNPNYVYDHSMKFLDYVETMKICEECKGLPVCAQPLKGMVQVLDFDGMLISVMKPCHYQRMENERYAHQKYYREMNMPKHFLEIDIAKINLMHEDNDYKMVVMAILQLLMNKESKKGIYFCGLPGVGKTYLAAGIANYYAKEKKSVAFVNVPRLIADLKLMFNNQDALASKLAGIRNVDVLVLDDIGAESMTSWSRDDILLPILDARMENHRLTFFTSNYPWYQLQEKLMMIPSIGKEEMGAKRVMERIKALSTQILLKGETRRK